MRNGKFAKEKIENVLLSFDLKGEIVDKKKGTYGIVFIVDHGESVYPRYIAYKTIDEQFKEKKLKEFVREARVWFKVKDHALTLTPFYIKYFKNFPLICMPFCEMDLQNYLEKHGRLKPIEALVFVAQILKGLAFAKTRGIEAHQDLKPRNILLEDLSKKFVDYPPKDADPAIRYRVRIADFGLANAWKELDKQYGSKPYMAPEQFERKEDFSRVDMFATGVILHELLTGKHPIGERTSDVWPEPKAGFPKKYKHDPYWKKWSKSIDKHIRIGDDELIKEFENLIKKMLLPDAGERISIEHALESIMSILSIVHISTANQLKFLFEYYDYRAGYLEDENRLHALVQISQLPGQLDVVVNELQEEISMLEEFIDTPRKAVYSCKLLYETSSLLLERRREGDDEKVKNFAERIILEVIKWKAEIKVHHKYPELKFKETTLIKQPPFRDFEVYAELIGYGRKLLENVIGREETESFFEKKDEYTKSAYFFTIASNFHSKGDQQKAIEILDKCIKLNPREAAFYYMKSLWTEHYLFERETLEKLENKEKEAFKQTMLRNAQKALQIDPNWEEPRKLVEKILKGKKENE